MTTLPKVLRSISSKISLGFAGLLLAGVGAAGAQAHPVADRLVQPVDESARVTLGHTVHPLANAANDRGAVSDGLKLDRLQIVLKRSDAQESELKQLVSDLHTPGTASYHRWLTPDDFGKRFGPSDADVAKVSAWLQSHGFAVTKLNPGRQTMEIAGSAGQFRDTFKAQIHAYQVKGAAGMETHYANAADPQIPAALSPVLGGFVSLNNFRVKSYSRKLGTAAYSPATHAVKPDWTIGSTDDTIYLAVSPGDFAVQYTLPSQATAGTNDGTGQSIAIVNEANINVSLVNRFRSLFGLSVNPPQVIIDGNDPGIDGINNPDGPNGASGEAYLDVEWAGAVAPAATVNLVIGSDTALSSGLFLAAQHAVYSNISPVISLSFGGCEAKLGSLNTFLSTLWEQAAAQGITVLVSSGDSGPADCDSDSQEFAVFGQSVNGFASTPYNLAVGGTDFLYTGGSTTLGNYWNLTPTNATPTVSLLKPVPEQPWNDSQFATHDLIDYATQNGGNTTIAAGAGGASTLGLASGSSFVPYPKPSWQSGTGVPADSARDIPDVSLFASPGANYSFYTVCGADGDCEPVATGGAVQVSAVGGTSASTPSFAGIMALVNQQYGRQGQAGYVLYPLATQFPSGTSGAPFNDVTIGTNTVPCNLQTVFAEVKDQTESFPADDCLVASPALTATDPTYGTSPEGEVGLANVATYNAGTGYDLASGLGSVNVTNLLTDWGKVTFGATATTMTVTPPTGATLLTIPHGTAVTLAGAVTGTGTPTGDVAVMTDSTTPLQAGQGYFTLANGSYSGTFTSLPGGTYNIWGNYGGDGTNAPSSSIANKTQVTVVQEASTTALSLYSGYDSSGNPVAAPSSVTYATQVLLSGQTSASNTTHTGGGAPTGSVVFTDGSSKIDTAVVNAEADAEYYATYAPGSHTFKAAYSGDASYGASTSATKSLTVTADTPTFLGPVYTNINSDGSALASGQQAIIMAVAAADASGDLILSGNAVAPAGTLTMTGGPAGSTTSATLVPAVDESPSLNISGLSGAVEGIGTFLIPATATSGNYNLTFTYTPSNSTYYSGISGTITGVPITGTTSGLLATTTTVAATPQAASPASTVVVTTTITGQTGHAAPTGTISFYTSDINYGSYTLPTGSGDATVDSLQFDSSILIQGSNPITVQYSGDSNYAASAATVTVANPLNDFQMVPLTTIIAVPSGSTTASDTINLASTNSFAGAVSFTCSAAGGVTCSLPASATLTAGGIGAVTLTVNTAAVSKAGSYNVLVTGSDSTGNYVHTLGLQAVVPSLSVAPSYAVTGAALAAVTVGNSATSLISVTSSGGFAGSVALTCAVTGATGAALPTCSLTPTPVAVSSTTTEATSTLTVATTATTTAGTYSVVVTGTSGSTTESVTLPLTVNSTTTTPSFALSGLANEAATAGGAPTSTVTVTPSGGFAGTVNLTCAVTGPTGAADVPTCALAPVSLGISSAAESSTLTVTTLVGTTAGAYAVTVTGTSGTTVETENFTLTVTASSTPGGIMVTAPAITIASQGASGTSVVTVTPTSGFIGNVAVTCAVTASPTGATDAPTCALTPTTVGITTTAAVTTTLVVNTTAQTTAMLHQPGRMLFTLGSGATLAALFFFGGPIGRRRKMTLKAMRTVRLLSAAALFALLAGAAMGCGSGSSSGGGGGGATGGTTTGTYTVTLMATPTPTGGTAGTALTTEVTVTVN